MSGPRPDRSRLSLARCGQAQAVEFVASEAQGEVAAGARFFEHVEIAVANREEDGELSTTCKKRLAKEHLGGKMGGKPFEIIYEDDQFKPDVGKARSEKLVQQDKVDFISGYIWSNVLLASLKTVVDEGDTILPFLIRHQVKEPFTYRHRWAEGDLLIWDNGCTMHRRDEMRLDQPRLHLLGIGLAGELFQQRGQHHPHQGHHEKADGGDDRVKVPPRLHRGPGADGRGHRPGRPSGARQCSGPCAQCSGPCGLGVALALFPD